MAASKGGYEGKIAGLYDLDRTLGKGHFAVVKLARHVFTGQLVAVKVIDKTKLDTMATGHLLQEVRCMKLVQHPNVVRLYEVIDTATKLYLILELGDGGDMYDYILRHEGGVAEDTAKVHFAQIVQSISYCHRLHVVHRDLKPENVVFFRQQGTVKLTDFGFSNLFKPGTMLMTSCGSLAYSAPEILLGDEYDAPAVDIWSLGVILFMLVCGQPPFQETNDSETLTMIMDCRYTVPTHVSADCKDLISRMLQRDPSSRASLEEIENHPWLQGVNPSPTGHSAAPLTSHRSLSQEEHEIILHAMTSGNISDRDAIQQALEADQYNHITATYYLLGERILRDKQEQPSEIPKVDSSWAEPSQLQRPRSEPLDLEQRGLHGLLAGCPRRGVSDAVDFLTHRPLLLQPQPSRTESPFPEYSTEPYLGLTLRPSPPDEPPQIKSLGALQLICEEEEEEEDEAEETGKPHVGLHNIQTLPHIIGLVSTSVSTEQSSPMLTAPEAPQSPVRVVLAQGEETGLLATSVEEALETERGEWDRELQARVSSLSREMEPDQLAAIQEQEQGTMESGEKPMEEGDMSCDQVAAIQEQEQGTMESGEKPMEEGDMSCDQLAAIQEQEQGTMESGEKPMEEGDMSCDQLRLGSHLTSDQPINSSSISPKAHPPYLPRLGGVQCCCGQQETPSPDIIEGEDAILKNNNTTESKLKLLVQGGGPTPGASPRFLPHNHCVDLGPDGVETTRKVKGPGGDTPEELQLERSHNAPQGRLGPRETGTDPTFRLDPGKGKNVNLRDRLLQFPLCEKALSFNIQPTSKEKLLPFAQYNCCHVL
nr:SNF-related serine/threonine-protein kinase-like isoform X1 [Oncorhynchus nerka]XP_029489917.1 SNF-related serine/threonine-protein kinase-like isoform X1 [Oncorhynchus nerka]